MGCDCGKPKCDGHCGVSPAVLQINNPSECVLFHRVEVPASMGDSKTNPPKNGEYKNVLLYYEADQTSWLYSSDGIPTKLADGLTAQKAPTAFTMQYTEGLGDWQSGNIYELVKKTAGSQTEYIYRADRHYYSGTGVSFLNEKTGVTLSPQELYALLLTGEDVVVNHVPLGWAVDNGGEAQYAGNYIDGIRLKRETIASQSGNVVSFNGSAFVTTYIPRSSSYEEIVQDTLGVVISGYEDDGAMVYDLVSIDGFLLFGGLQ